MKKVITIHINGLLFHMEEDGFNMMRESLFRQGKQGDKATEAVLAEKFSALINSAKQVVTLTDVQNVLAQLGFKSTFDTSPSYSGNTYEPKRLYRKTTDKVIGGVCSGLGEYWDIDPTLLRILFVIAIFGFGVGLMFYILLWIIIPEKKLL
jgi:phage shock protein PspC (stress-responsive transcriptional regulator)